MNYWSYRSRRWILIKLPFWCFNSVDCSRNARLYLPLSGTNDRFVQARNESLWVICIGLNAYYYEYLYRYISPSLVSSPRRAHFMNLFRRSTNSIYPWIRLSGQSLFNYSDGITQIAISILPIHRRVDRYIIERGLVCPRSSRNSYLCDSMRLSDNGDLIKQRFSPQLSRRRSVSEYPTVIPCVAITPFFQLLVKRRISVGYWRPLKESSMDHDDYPSFHYPVILHGANFTEIPTHYRDTNQKEGRGRRLKGRDRRQKKRKIWNTDVCDSPSSTTWRLLDIK